MLGLLIFSGVVCISGICCLKDNIEMKNSTRHYDSNGNLVYYDRKCRKYINGEKVHSCTETDQYGHSHGLTVGDVTGTVYEDNYDRCRHPRRWLSEQSKKRAIERGALAYPNFNDPRFDKEVLTELSTGKVITCLYEYTNPTTGKKEYRKWYLTDALYREWGKSAYCHTGKGDYGILITKEEYWGLGGNSNPFLIAPYPDDRDVRRKFGWTWL